MHLRDRREIQLFGVYQALPAGMRNNKLNRVTAVALSTGSGGRRRDWYASDDTPSSLVPLQLDRLGGPVEGYLDQLNVQTSLDRSGQLLLCRDRT